MAGTQRRVDFTVGWATSDPGDYVLVGNRAVSRKIEVTFPGVEGQPRLDMTIDSSSGVPRCTHVEVASVELGREVRTTDLRAIELANWVEAIVPMFMDDAEVLPDGTVKIVVAVKKDDAQLSAAVKDLRSAKRADRRKIDDDFLRRVAAVYQSHGLRPGEAVSLAFVVAPRTAFRYIRLARERGFLPAREGD